MHISNFRPVKRVPDVVQIFAAVRRDIPSVLVMVGDGPDRSAAEEEARGLGVEADVRFLGKIDGVAPLLASADLYLLTTDRESFGLSALEAQACGVPVLGYDVGGLPEVVQSGVTGHLGVVGDIVGMAGTAIEILGSDALWQAMSAAASRRATPSASPPTRCCRCMRRSTLPPCASAGAPLPPCAIAGAPLPLAA